MLTTANTPDTIQVSINLEDFQIINAARRLLQDLALAGLSDPLHLTKSQRYRDFQELCNILANKFVSQLDSHHSAS